MYLPIDPKREYAPMEIIKNGYILNTLGKQDYRYVLRLIEAGKLKARNVCTGRGKYFRVRGEDIIKWKESTYNIPEQPGSHDTKDGTRRPFPQPPKKKR